MRLSEKLEKTIRILSEPKVDILNLSNNQIPRFESKQTMVRQHLASTAPDEISQYRETREVAASFHKRVALISSLLDSLIVAIDDLETSELPPLNEDFDFYGEVRRFEITLIKKALRTTGGSQTQAAKLLKLLPTTLNTKIKNYQISAYQG